jgi:hypothetical protein
VSAPFAKDPDSVDCPNCDRLGCSLCARVGFVPLEFAEAFLAAQADLILAPWSFPTWAERGDYQPGQALVFQHFTKWR